MSVSGSITEVKTLLGESVLKLRFNKLGLTLSSILSFLFFFFDFLTYSGIKLCFSLFLKPSFCSLTTPSYLILMPSATRRYPYVPLDSSNTSLIIK